MDQVKHIDATVDKALSNFIRKPTIVRGVVHLLLTLYVARVAPQLPESSAKVFQNTYFKMVVFFLVLWTARVSPSTSMLISIAFVVSMNKANQLYIENNFNKVKEQIQQKFARKG